MADVAAGIIADVTVRVISADLINGTAVVRVIDNNGGFITAAVTLPIGVVKPTQFPVVVGDVLEQVAPDQRTAVVRWVSGTGETWSESPTGVPGRDTIGWRRLGSFAL